MVFLRHKTKLADTGFFRDFVDSHSHILSGVDDGIRTIEESLTVLAYFESLGVKKVRLTPHVMNGVEHWKMCCRLSIRCASAIPEKPYLNWELNICWTPASGRGWRRDCSLCAGIVYW